MATSSGPSIHANMQCDLDESDVIIETQHKTNADSNSDLNMQSHNKGAKQRSSRFQDDN